MKLRKVLSVLCAVAILTSALPAAFAVEAESLSEYAGGTVACQVFEMTENGPAAVTYNVPIPAGATKEAEREIVRSYVMAAGNSGAAQTRGYNAFDKISEVKDLEIKKTAWTWIGGGKLGKNYNVLYVEFTSIDRIGADEVNVKAVNVTKDKNETKQLHFISVPHINYTYFTVSNIPLKKDDVVDFTAQTAYGSLEGVTCTVLGSVD